MTKINLFGVSTHLFCANFLYLNLIGYKNFKYIQKEIWDKIAMYRLMFNEVER